jgi:hypothetical protein
MDPTPQSHPILAYVLSRLPSLPAVRTPRSPSLTSSSPRERDLEQPSPRTPSGAAEIDLVGRMPGLRHPSVLSAMTRAVADVASARDAIRVLAPRPDHEQVDAARALLLSASSGDNPGATAEEEEEKLEASREVVRLEEEHEAYGAMLREAEEKLESVYRMAMHGRDIQEGGGGDRRKKGEEEEGSGEVDKEVVRVLKEAEEGRTLERVDLADRQLRLLPEPIGRIRGLLALDVSRNQLKVRDSYTHETYTSTPRCTPAISLSDCPCIVRGVRHLF